MKRSLLFSLAVALGICAGVPAQAAAAGDAQDPAIGQWMVEGHVPITLEANHTITGGRHGSWRYTGIVEGARHYELKWQPPKDWSDSVNISEDGSALNGQSRGKPIAYVRAPGSAASDAGKSAPSAPNPEEGAKPSEILAKQAPNVMDWALAPLDKVVPGDIRRNMTLLREDLLDEAAKEPRIRPAAYNLGEKLCNALVQAMDARDQARVQAGYAGAQAKANMGEITNQALEARRRYTNWPTYWREKDQRGEVGKEKENAAELEKQRPVLEWAARAAQFRRMLDGLYAQYREAARQPLAAPRS